MTGATMTVPRSVRGPWRIVLAVVAVVLASLVVPGTAAADEAEVSWSVQPSTPAGPDGRPAFDYQVAAGTTISDWVAVTNFSAGEVTFRVYAADALTDYDTGAFTLVGADEPSADVGAWTSLVGAASTCPPDASEQATAACALSLGIEVTLAAGERADIPFTLAVPHDATPGDHAAGIVASYVSQTEGEGGTTVRREDRTGTRIYVRVDGAVSASLGVSGVVAGYDASLNPFAGGTGRLGFDVTNTGNVRLTAAPEVRLTGPFGIALRTVHVTPVENLMPGGTAHVAAEFPGVPPLLLLFADVTVSPGTADGVANATDRVPPAVSASARAWAVPWALLGLVVLVGAGTWLLVARRRRARARLAADLADYADRIRAESAAGALDPAHESETAR